VAEYSQQANKQAMSKKIIKNDDLGITTHDVDNEYKLDVLSAWLEGVEDGIESHQQLIQIKEQRGEDATKQKGSCSFQKVLRSQIVARIAHVKDSTSFEDLAGFAKFVNENYLEVYMEYWTD